MPRPPPPRRGAPEDAPEDALPLLNPRRPIDPDELPDVELPNRRPIEPEELLEDALPLPRRRPIDPDELPDVELPNRRPIEPEELLDEELSLPSRRADAAGTPVGPDALPIRRGSEPGKTFPAELLEFPSRRGSAPDEPVELDALLLIRARSARSAALLDDSARGPGEVRVAGGVSEEVPASLALDGNDGVRTRSERGTVLPPLPLWLLLPLPVSVRPAPTRSDRIAG